MNFLIDTNICSAYLKGDSKVWNMFLQYSGGVAISVRERNERGRRTKGDGGTPSPFSVFLSWLLLTVAFEILFGRFVMGLTWKRIGTDYNVAQGGLMPLGLLWLLFSPLLASKLREKR